MKTLMVPAVALLLIGAGCAGAVTPEAGAGEAQNTLEPPTEVVTEEVQQEAAPQDGELELDMEASSVTWMGDKKIGDAHEGTINISTGSLSFAEGKLVGGTVVLDMNSIKSTDLEGDTAATLEKHLKSEDFFETETYPEATFSILAVNYTSESTASVTGELTLHGVTNPVTLETTLSDMDGVWVAESRVVLDRTLWNVNYGSGSIFKGLGDNIINDEMTIAFTVQTK
jgi:polyisoprenoid-binding protein YceI